MARKGYAWLQWHYDPPLVLSVLALLLLGLVMVTSASMGVAEQRTGEAFYYAFHHAAYLGVGCLIIFLTSQIPVAVWSKISGVLMIVTFVILAAVFLPGIGKTVNGSTRWLNLGIISVQVSELVKIFVILFLAGYIARRHKDLKEKLSAFIKPMVVLCCISALLLLEPDFGATVVIMATGLGMLFLSGVPWRYFLVLVMLLVVALGGLMVSAPYRLKRLTAFLDPWAYQYDSGYQLTQALIAFGRGEWFGVGLGGSVQKLFYLPESYTDFIFAVLAEELGLLGAAAVVLVYGVLTARGLKIGLLAERRHELFSAFVAYGLIFWLGLQALINMGVNTGLLPTKGLTLPFISYGGSSLLIACMGLGILFRIDRDNRVYYRREAGFARK